MRFKNYIKEETVKTHRFNWRRLGYWPGTTLHLWADIPKEGEIDVEQIEKDLKREWQPQSVKVTVKKDGVEAEIIKAGTTGIKEE